MLVEAVSLGLAGKELIVEELSSIMFAYVPQPLEVASVHNCMFHLFLLYQPCLARASGAGRDSHVSTHRAYEVTLGVHAKFSIQGLAGGQGALGPAQMHAAE